MISDPRRVLVTGATGVIGPGVVDVFAAAGWAVTVLARETFAGDPGGRANVFVGSILDSDAVRRAVAGCHAVVHLAAKLHVESPRAGDLAEYQPVNVDGTRCVVDAARWEGAHVVAASTIAVYGPTHGRVVDEETPPRPETVYARTKLDAERIVLDAGGTVLRLGAIYGPRMKGNYRRLARAIARGRFVPVGSGTNRRSVLYQDDAAMVFRRAAERRVAGGLFNIADPRPYTVREILDAIADAVGRRPPRWTIPAGAVRAACGLVEGISALVAVRPLVTRATLDKWTEDLAVRADRARSVLDFQPMVDLHEGWWRTVAALRAAGEVP